MTSSPTSPLPRCSPFISCVAVLLDAAARISASTPAVCIPTTKPRCVTTAIAKEARWRTARRSRPVRQESSAHTHINWSNPTSEGPSSPCRIAFPVAPHRLLRRTVLRESTYWQDDGPARSVARDSTSGWRRRRRPSTRAPARFLFSLSFPSVFPKRPIAVVGCPRGTHEVDAWFHMKLS